MNPMRKAEGRNHIRFDVCANVIRRPYICAVYLGVVPLLNLNVEIMLNSCYSCREFLVLAA